MEVRWGIHKEFRQVGGLGFFVGRCIVVGVGVGIRVGVVIVAESGRSLDRHPVAHGITLGSRRVVGAEIGLFVGEWWQQRFVVGIGGLELVDRGIGLFVALKHHRLFDRR